MSVDENLRVIEQYAPAYNARDFEALAQLFEESAVFYAPGRLEPLKGRDRIRNAFAATLSIFPDTHYMLEGSFGQGEWVCAQFVWTGTHMGPVPGPGGQTIPATNRSVRLPFVIIAKFDRGRIAEVREYYDRLSFMQQIGVATLKMEG